MLRILSLILLLLPTLACSGTIYKSRSADGGSIYSDQPVSNARNQQAIEFSEAPATPMPDSVLRYRQELEKNMQKHLGDAKRPTTGQPLLFTASWCGYCRKAKAYLAEKRVVYDELDIDTESGMRALVEAGGGKAVPLLLWRGQRLQGFSGASYDQFLNKR